MTTSDQDPPRHPPHHSEGGAPKSIASKGIAGAIDGGMEACRSCGRPVAPRALFCHSCGAAQPPRPLDPFTRLGLERRFDLDSEALARQYAGFSRALDPQRFAARGARQQENARAQAAALAAAHEVLRDPVSRAYALLDLDGVAPPTDTEDDEEVAELETDVAAAPDAPAIDRLASRIGQRIESCIKYLAIAFRNGQTDKAALLLARLERLEALRAEARARRPGAPPVP